MKEKNTNKAGRVFLDVYSEETRPQVAEPSGQSVHSDSAPTIKRISAKMKRGTLEAYKQTFLVPAKLTERRAVYLSRAKQDRADFVVRRLGDRGVAKAIIQRKFDVRKEQKEVGVKSKVCIFNALKTKSKPNNDSHQ